MSLKKIKTIGIFIIFFFCFFTHFVYVWFPSFFTSLFFPVNESIWEHMKMLICAIIIWEFLEFLILKHFDIYFNNFVFAVFIMCFLSIIVFIIVYYPIYLVLSSSFLFNIICLFITIYFVSVVGYYIMKQSHIKYGFVIGIVGIIFLYVLFGLLTYFPIKNNLFVDPRYNACGLLDISK